jgi:HK97 family phage portal protein
MFNWLTRLVPTSAKQSATGSIIYTGRKEVSWSKREYAAFADEAYRRNVIAYQAIHKTAQAVATIPWYAVKPNGDELIEHPFLSLLEKPNPMQSRYEFLQALVGFYRISGNGYMERVTIRGAPRELYALRSDRMKVLPSSTGIPKGYVYTVGQNQHTWEADQSNGACDIRHIKDFNPLDDWYGMSPIEAGAFAVDQHNETMVHIQSLLQNGAAPSGALEVPGELTPEQYNRLKAEIDEKYTGARNAGRPFLSEGGMKWTQMGLSPQAMMIIDTKYSAARDISLALGVPPLLLNIPGDSTYSNYKEARLAFYEETIIPLAQYIRDELNHWLSDSFGGVTLEIDLDQIPAIAEKRRELWTMADTSADLTINEKRAIKGYDEVEGGDTVYISAGMIPLSFDLDMPTDDAKSAGAAAYGNADRE